MGEKSQSHQTVTMRLSEQLSSKRKLSLIHRDWLTKMFGLWILAIFFMSMFIFNYLDAMNNEKRKEGLVSWAAISSAFFIFVIGFLVGYMIYGAGIHILKVEDDFNKMHELKVKAEAANVAKSQLLATLSHEITTPMTGILGMLTDLLLDTDLSPTQRDKAQKALACGEALITCIDKRIAAAGSSEN